MELTQIQAVPISVSETKFKDAAAGSGHVAAVSANGTVYTWGENGEGQLGRGSESSKYLTSPGYIKTMYDIDSVYAGPNSSAAIRSDKSIYMWGTTYLGQLGKDEKPIILDNNEENLVITDSEGYYKYDKPRRMRYCYWDIDEKDYKGRNNNNCRNSLMRRISNGRSVRRQIIYVGRQPEAQSEA